MTIWAAYRLGKKQIPGRRNYFSKRLTACGGQTTIAGLVEVTLFPTDSCFTYDIC